MPRTAKPERNLALAKSLLEAGIEEGQRVFVLRSPVAGTERAKEVRDKEIYGVTFREGVGVTTDGELAEKIHAEFPDYQVTEA